MQLEVSISDIYTHDKHFRIIRFYKRKYRISRNKDKRNF